MDMNLDVKDLIEEINVFDGQAPNHFSWTPEVDGWPYMEIRVKGGCSVMEAGKYLEGICRTVIPDISFCGNCMKGYHLKVGDSVSPKDYFAIKISLIEGDVGPIGMLFRLVPENPKKDVIRGYRDGLAREFEQKGTTVYYNNLDISKL